MSKLKFTSVNGDVNVCLETLTLTDHILTATIFKPDRFQLKENRKVEDVVMSAYLFNDKTEQLVAEVKHNAVNAHLGISPVHLHFGTLIQSTEMLEDIRGAKFTIAGVDGPIQLIASEPFLPAVVKAMVRDNV